MKLSLFPVTILAGLLIACAANSSNMLHPVIHQGKVWCVVTVSASNEELQAFLSSACGQVDCRDIQPGGSCFQPNTLQNHASYVLNLVYRMKGYCDSNVGTPSVQDPSYGSCHYF